MNKLVCINSACGQELGGEVRFCPFCGVSQDSVNKSKSTEERSPATAVMKLSLPATESAQATSKYIESTDSTSEQLSEQTSEKQKKPTKATSDKYHTGYAAKSTTNKSITVTKLTAEAVPSPFKKLLTAFLKAIKFIATILAILFIAFCVWMIYSINSGDDKPQTKTTTSQKQQAPVSYVSMKIRTVPENARVRVMNIGPAFRQGMKLQPGTYDIEVSHPGYQTQRKKVNLSRSSNQFNFTLDRVYKVAVRKLPPAGYALSKNGKRLSLPIETNAGVLDFYVTAPGHYRQLFRVNVNKDGYVEADLKPIQCRLVTKKSAGLDTSLNMTVNMGPLSQDRLANGYYNAMKAMGDPRNKVSRNSNELRFRRFFQGKDHYVDYVVRIYGKGGSAYFDLEAEMKNHIPFIQSIQSDAAFGEICKKLKKI